MQRRFLPSSSLPLESDDAALMIFHCLRQSLINIRENPQNLIVCLIEVIVHFLQKEHQLDSVGLDLRNVGLYLGNIGLRCRRCMIHEERILVGSVSEDKRAVAEKFSLKM